MKISVSWFESREGVVFIPKGYGFAYKDFFRALDIYYPIPINYIVRYWPRCYWRFLRIFYWIGLIDVSPNEEF